MRSNPDSARQRLAVLYRVLFRAIGRLGWLPGLLVRVTLAVVFVQSGWGKVHHLHEVTGYFASLGIPAPHAQAVFVSSLELLGGSLLLLGLATRFVSVPLAITMIVALVTAKASEIETASDVLRQIEFLYLAMFGVLILQGAGPLSLDHWLARRLLAPGRPSSGQAAILDAGTELPLGRPDSR